MYESELPKGDEPSMPPPGAAPAEPGAPPPMADKGSVEVPDYGAPAEGMTSGSWWDSMASLTLCGKKVTNEQAKAIFTGMMAFIVLLVVVVIVMASGDASAPADDGADLVTGGPGVSQNYNGGGAGVQNTVRTSDWVRLSGENAVCSPGGCTGRIEVSA